MRFPKFFGGGIMGTIENYGRRITDLELKHQDCEAKHETTSLHRRKSDEEMIGISATLKANLETNNKILAKIEEFEPVFGTSKKYQLFIVTAKEISIWIAAVFVAYHYIIMVFS